MPACWALERAPCNDSSADCASPWTRSTADSADALVNTQDDIPSASEEGDEQTGDQPPAAVVRQLDASFAAFSGMGPSYHPIFDKFENEHVSQFLNQSHQQEQDERQFKRSNRWFRLIYALMGLGVFVFMTLLSCPNTPASTSRY